MAAALRLEPPAAMADAEPERAPSPRGEAAEGEVALDRIDEPCVDPEAALADPDRRIRLRREGG